MMITFWTFVVVAHNFYRPSLIEASLSVREDSNWKIECVVGGKCIDGVV